MKENNTKPYWLESARESRYPKLPGKYEADVVIIGGGICGLTTAYLLRNSGLKVVVVEKDKIGHGVSGHTTAKITVLHGLIYNKLLKTIGEDLTSKYLRANQKALDLISEIIKENKIRCEFEKITSYVYTTKRDRVKDVKEEVEAMNFLGADAVFVKNVNLPFKILGAVSYENQAQFHPMKYLSSLANKIAKKQDIFENTRVIDIKEGNVSEIITEHGIINARHVVVTSHYPIYNIKPLLFMRLYPFRSYVVGIRTKKDFPFGMFYSSDEDVVAVRSAPLKDGNLILVSGESHNVGQGNELEHMKKLEKFAKKSFSGKVEYFWSTQDNQTSDGIPIIGRVSKNSNIYVACGFGGWGMTNGTCAAMIISDLICGVENEFSDVFSPLRFKQISNRKFFKENASIGKMFLGDRLSLPEMDISQVKKNEGKVIRFEGKKIAAYRDNKGKLHLLNPICTHLKCIVRWNNYEKSWDCPCHGSRFSFDGEVLHGPATRDLEKINLKD